MVKTNIQTFTGEVEILSNLHVGPSGSSYLTANGAASNVLDITGNVGATFFVGDGGFLSNIATTLSDIVNQGNVSANVLQFNSTSDYAGVGLVTSSNVGIQNTAPSHTLSIGDKIRVDDNTVETSGQSVIQVDGRILATRFQGDGGLLSNIATTFESIVNQGNVASNVVKFSSDSAYAGAGVITDSNVGIQNTAPTHNLSVGSNLHVNDTGSNVLTVHGNVVASNLNLGVFSITPAYGLNDVCNTSNGTSNVVQFQNATTSLIANSNIVVSGNVTALQLISTANTEVGDRLKFSGSNVFVDTLRVADVAANIVTYDRTTGELLDSSGTFMNKFAVVSEQPPSDIFSNTITVANHGGYTLTTSNLATNSNTYNAFDGTANAWVSGDLAGGYIGGANVFHENNLTQLSNLHPTQFGDWLAIEFPYKTTLRHMKLTPLTAAQFPASANIYATNNDLTWTEVNYWKDVNPVTASNVQTITVNATEQFKKYALVATKAAGNSSNVAIKDWQLFTESFSIDGGKVAMAQQAATGGETVMDQHGPHGRLPTEVPLKKYPEIAFDGKIGNFVSIPEKGGHNQTSNTYTIGGYEVVASSESLVYNSTRMSAWKLFDSGLTEYDYSGWGLAETFDAYNAANPGEYPSSGTARLATTDVDGNSIETGGWIYIKLPNKIKLKSYALKPWGIANRYGVGDYPKEFYIYASNDGTNWKLINSQPNAQTPSIVGSTTSSQETISYDVNQTGLGYYSYYAMTIRRINSVAVQAVDSTVAATFCVIGDWKLYGYEEDQPLGDTSVDTTFTSIMNTPQTTGVQVYVDGSLGGNANTNRVVGPAAANTAATYDTTGKYWELNGTLTSNISVEANTFLSGDQPHAVSVWFNSSNLEANTSNSCIFSLGTEERLDHVGIGAYQLLSNTYQIEQKIVASDDAANDGFGHYKASSMSNDGNHIIIGAPGHNSDGGNDEKGSAYYFLKSGTTWSEQQILQPSDPLIDTNFGVSVAISGNGLYAAIGRCDVDNINQANNAVYIFKLESGTWVQKQKLGLPSGFHATASRFGTDVSLTTAGDCLIVGTGLYSASNAPGGAVVYNRTNESWAQESALLSGSTVTADEMGMSVSISGDGNYAIVGAWRDDDQGADAGTAHIFKRASATTWDSGFKITGSDIDASDFFGYTVSIDSTGTYAIVGAYYHNAGVPGAAYIFYRAGSTNSWTQQADLAPTDIASGDQRFGNVVEMSPDGLTALIDSTDGTVVSQGGGVHRWTRSGSTWTEQATIRSSDAGVNDRFGSSISCSSDASYIVVGAWQDDDGGSRSGSAYIYTRDTFGHPGSPAKLKLQSNTWHNLTYAYQGEGGSRVTYLDGRKVAEDQAEDTFKEYPPFAIRNYSYGEYCVSSSSEYGQAAGVSGGVYPPWDAFDDLTGTTDYWSGGGGAAHTTALYNTSSPFNFTGYGPPYETSVSGTTYTGDWIQLEMPHKLVLKYSNIKAGGTATTRFPRQGVFAGSNDGVNWDAIHTFSGLNGGTTETSIVTNSENNTEGYKYIRLIITHLNGQGYAGITTLKFYGHRENDLVRLPDPTNVLKYPHIAMKGPAQRGYVASSSSSSGSLYRPWRAFNDIVTSNDVWTTLGSPYNTTNGSYAGGTTYQTTVTGHTPTAVNGEFLQIEFPHKIKPTKFRLSSYPATTGSYRQPRDGVFAGSNNGTDWVLLKSYTNQTSWSSGVYVEIIPDTNTTTAYKYLRLIITNVNTNSDGACSIHSWQILGTGVDSVPIQIGGGNIDKVANFRVYDKFIEEDQALEIWDAQKDEFGRAKSSMTLQKGCLGIGTTEPEGRLAVLDEPHNLEEFPPSPMSDYKTYFEGHGEFCVSATTEYSGNWAYEAFDKVTSRATGGGTHWSQADPSHYDNSTGEYTGPSDYFTNVEGQVALGHWLQIEFPYKIKYSYSTIQGPFHAAGRQPHTGYIVGSNDLSGTWTSLHNFKNMKRIGPPDSRRNSRDFLTYTPPTVTTQTFKYFRLVIEKLGGGNSHAGVDQWNIFGTREQGQSVLHDGQLTLTKNLNVPRIGPDLDADDTPHRDRLVVEYNTSTNQPTGVDDGFGGVVRDTSGRGNDGVYYRRAAAGAGITGGYNTDEKAFEFNTQNTPEQHIQTRINNHSGDYIHSVSVWFKTNKDTATISTNEETLFQIGNDFANGVNPYVSFYANNLYYAWHSHNIYCATTDVVQGGWNHVCVTYTGGGSTTTSRKIYLNGKVQSATLTGTSGALLNLPENTFVTLGAKKRPTDTIHYLDGFISDFKLYDIALTASEAKTLYDMGRNGSVANSQPLHIAAPLMDVRGDSTLRGIVNVNGYNPPWPDRGKFALQVIEAESSTLTTKPGGGIRIIRNGDPSEYWNIGLGMPASARLVFTASDPHGGRGGWIDRGVATRIMNNFTGQHRTFINDVPFSQAGDLEGLIVSSDQNKYIKMSGGIEAGSNAITTNESLPIVSLSNAVTDKKCFGVISASEDPEERSDVYGAFGTNFEKEKGDTRVFINSLGEGAIWVSNIGGNLESGDYITTSNIAGYGQKQESDSLKNYTVAKITMDCDFNPATQPIQQILRSNVVETYYLGNVHKVKSVPHEFVTTTVGAEDAWSNVSVKPSDVTYAEWSNLEANTQNTYNLTYTQTSNVVYDTKYTLTTTANVTESDPWDSVFVDPPDVTYAQYSNLEANTQSSYSLTFTKTTTDEKTPEEWSTLESNTQSLYNMVYYQSVEEEVAAEYPGATTHTRVTDVIENELDAHGQIQWEDHATETEKAYKVRYLTASGAQTDSANAVHIAAFVGCTYHCG